MIVVFLIVGVAITSLGLFLLLDLLLFRTKAEQVNGKVVAYEKGNFNGSRVISYAPVVRYEVENITYQFLSNISASTVAYDIGEKVPVLLLKDQHSSAHLKRNDRVGLSLGLTFIGLAPLLAVYDKMGSSEMIPLVMQGALLAVVVSVFVLLQFSKGSRSKQEDSFSHEPNREGLIGYEMTDNIETSTSVLNRTKPTKATYKVSIVIGLGLLLFSLYWADRVHKYINNAIRTHGTIVEKKSSFHDGALVYAPVIEYKPYKREPLRFTSKLASSSPSWQVGDDVYVLYKGDDITDVMMDRGFWNYIVQIVMGFIAMFIIVVTFWKWPRG